MYDEPTPTRVVIYVRISDDREGAGAGVARQREDSLTLAKRLGWEVHEVVPENDTSAFKRRRVRRPNGSIELRVSRPGFRRVLDMLQSGEADGLIAYDLDRTARDPRDLEDLIDVVESRTPRIPVRSVSGSLRLDNDADVTMARVMVAVANKSSRDTQRRVARKHEEIAKAGKYGGGGARRYGYELDGTTVREDEAEVIREMAARILAGESSRSICLDLNARGVRPVKAAKWSTNTIIGILRSARIAGLREHRGEIVGQAAWPAIIDTQTRDALLGQLALNSIGIGKPALRHWCNRLLWCSKCGRPLIGAAGNDKRGRYWCATNREPRGCGSIAISGLGVEREVERQVLAYLARPDVVRAFAEGSTQVAAEETRRLLEEDERALRELARMHGERQIRIAEWMEARAPIEARVKTYAQALRAIVPARARHVMEARDKATAWSTLGPEGRREVAMIVLAAGGWKGWEVAPADLTKARRFDPSRLDLVAASASEPSFPGAAATD